MRTPSPDTTPEAEAVEELAARYSVAWRAYQTAKPPPHPAEAGSESGGKRIE